MYIILLGLLSISLHAQSQKINRSGTFGLYFENDLFAGTDRCFTGGFKLGWVSKNIPNPKEKSLLKLLPFVNKPGYHHTFSLSLGQNIFTPDNITISEIIEDDRPYAGILYFAFGMHSMSQRRLLCWEFNIGIVGPHSYAEQAQKIIHNLTKGVQPKGWDNQLKDELMLQLIHERKWKYSLFNSENSFGFELIPHLGAGMGNVYIYGSSGIQMRMGWNLPKDFGTPLIRPGGDTFLTATHYGIATE